MRSCRSFLTPVTPVFQVYAHSRNESKENPKNEKSQAAPSTNNISMICNVVSAATLFIEEGVVPWSARETIAPHWPKLGKGVLDIRPAGLPGTGIPESAL